MTQRRRFARGPHGTTEGIWQGLQRIAVTGVLMVAPSYALGQERLPPNAELERRELILENLHYQILIPRNARLDTTGRPDCVKIWHPRSTRTMTFLELCSHSSPSPAGFTSQTTLRNGARVRYNIDRNLGGGSGGTEGELKGELYFGGRVFALTCRDQGEWGNTPDWCLNYVGYLEVRERH